MSAVTETLKDIDTVEISEEAQAIIDSLQKAIEKRDIKISDLTAMNKYLDDFNKTPPATAQDEVDWLRAYERAE